jgi:hypothetical protein
LTTSRGDDENPPVSFDDRDLTPDEIDECVDALIWVVDTMTPAEQIRWIADEVGTIPAWLWHALVLVRHLNAARDDRAAARLVAVLSLPVDDDDVSESVIVTAPALQSPRVEPIAAHAPPYASVPALIAGSRAA